MIVESKGIWQDWTSKVAIGAKWCKAARDETRNHPALPITCGTSCREDKACSERLWTESTHSSGIFINQVTGHRSSLPGWKSIWGRFSYFSASRYNDLCVSEFVVPERLVCAEEEWYSSPFSF
jgi:hypothetical protein